MKRLIALLALAAIVTAALATTASAEPSRKYDVLRWREDWSWVGIDRARSEDAFDRVKNHPLGGEWYLTWGGSVRARYETDDNRTLGASPVDEDRLGLVRAFTHLELRRSESFRFFGEIRWSDTVSEDRPPLGIFQDDLDVQNFFFEWTHGAGTDTPVDVRVGRQELLFGNQHLVSPLNWSSTRRTFDGVTVTVGTPKTSTVLFATSPVAHEPNDIDSPIDEQVFWGAHSTIKPASGHAWEAWAYFQDDDRDTFVGESVDTPGELSRTTLGGRYVFSRDGWKVDVEAAVQEGDVAHDDINAWMASLTLGRSWSEPSWKPNLQVGYDVATGDGDPLDGDVETFNHLFPLGHAYFGHLDLVGRQNIEAARVQLTLKPTSKLKWVTSFHVFDLEESTDALYNAGGRAIRRDATGAAGSDVATELDMLLAYAIGQHQSVALEVTRWWSGDFIEHTGLDDDAWFAWAAWEFKF